MDKQKQDILNKVMEIVKDKCGNGYDINGNKLPEIRPDTTISTIYGLDSLDEIEIIIEVEKLYGISITTEELRDNIKTIDDCCDIIIKKLPQKEVKQPLFYRIKQHFQRTK